MKHRKARTRPSARIREAASIGASLLLIGWGTVMLAGPSSAEGNNGTVKIDGWTLDHGTGNGAPNRNEPHVGCTFDVEWYNFDASVTSTVTFTMQAPTKSVGLSGTEPSAVLLDGDDASGANAAGLDATQSYTLAFDGAPHTAHGYHVKLTVKTPTSNGADTKYKVFWVEGCETPPEEIPLPEPTVDDSCGWATRPGTSRTTPQCSTGSWSGGDLTVTILTEDTVFEGTGETTHNFGPAVETNTDYCYEEPDEIAIPATPTVDRLVWRGRRDLGCPGRHRSARLGAGRTVT